MNMKHIFILKPNTSKELVNCIVSSMQGKHYVLRYTKDLDDAREIALSYQEEKEICRLYAIGGDGFVHKVVNGMVHSHHELVVIPQGTGNDYRNSHRRHGALIHLQSPLHDRFVCQTGPPRGNFGKTHTIG